MLFKNPTLHRRGSTQPFLSILLYYLIMHFKNIFYLICDHLYFDKLNNIYFY